MGRMVRGRKESVEKEEGEKRKKIKERAKERK
jgi:hypothetical protein